MRAWLSRLLLLMSVVAAISWALSYCTAIISSEGRILVLGGDARNVGQFRAATQRAWDASLWHSLALKPDTSWKQSGFEFHKGIHKWEKFYLDYRYSYGGGDINSTHVRKESGQFQYWLLAIPYWPLVSLGLVLPASFFAVRALRGERRRARNLCQHCGYDLRATPERCPECGTVPKKSNKISTDALPKI
jgi:hypothetical protein